MTTHKRNPYLLLFILLFLSLILTPIFVKGDWKAIACEVLMFTLLIFALGLILKNLLYRILIIFTCVLLAVEIANIYLRVPYLDHLSEFALLSITGLLCHGIIFHMLFNRDTTPTDRILAGASGYLALGLLFASLCEVLHVFSPGGAFAFGQGGTPVKEKLDFIYLSFISLTTLGYGDIVPTTSWAKILSLMEAVVGILYTTILISALASGLNFDRLKKE